MLSLSSHFPFSKVRTKAAAEFDQELRNTFETLTQNSDAQLKDSIHYLLFRHKDRFCMSSAWLIAKDLGIKTQHLSPALCALEFIRIAVGTAVASTTAADNSNNYMDKSMTQQAILSLCGMAQELIYNRMSNPEVRDQERQALSQIFGMSLAPLHIFSSVKRDRACPIFEATGMLFDVAIVSSGTKVPATKDSFRKFFKKLGLLVELADEERPEIDLIKTVESEIFEEASIFGIKNSVFEIIEPLTELFEDQLQ